MTDISNIFPSDEREGQRGKLSEERLQAYLEGRLTPEEQHEVELWLAEEGMESDAVEGLHQIEAGKLRESVGRINRQLHQQLKDKKRKRRMFYKGDRWALLAIFIILLLCLLAYAVMHTSLNR